MPTSVPDPLERLAVRGGLPAIVDVEPARAADYTFTRLPDARVANRALPRDRGPPVATDLGFDRRRASRWRARRVWRSRPSWLQAATLVRRVDVDPADVRDYDGRFLPTRRSVERPGNGDAGFLADRRSCSTRRFPISCSRPRT